LSRRDEQIAKRLGRHPVFAALGQRERLALARAGVRRNLAAGRRLFVEGDDADRLIVVLGGQIDIERVGEGGERRLYRRLGTDAVIGLSTVAGATHSADVVARTESRVLSIEGDALRDAFARRPAAALAAISALGDLVAKLSDELAEAAGGSLLERLERRLRRIAGDRREIEITHAELAGQLGAERANVSRALARLEDSGVLKRRRGRIEILH